MAGKGLYANIHAKRKRGGKMRKKGAKGAPKASDFKRAKKVAVCHHEDWVELL
jgi:hypothetical protein